MPLVVDIQLRGMGPFMTNSQTVSNLLIHICSKNPVATWCISNILEHGSLKWSLSVSFIRPLPIISEETHILLTDIVSISEWPEIVRKWNAGGYKAMLLVSEGWGSGGVGLRALHLGVRGIVHVAQDFHRKLLEAISIVANGQLFVNDDILKGYCDGMRPIKDRLRSNYLSFREQQVMDLLLIGFSNRKIGSILGISERTAKFHVCNILHKLQVTTRRELLDQHRNSFTQYQPSEAL